MGRHKKGKQKEHTPTYKQAVGLKRGVRIRSQTKLVVENVRRYFDALKSKGHNHGVNVLGRTAEATGLSKASVKRIHQEYIGQDSKFLTPVKRYAVSRVRVNPDSFDRAAV